MTHSRDSGSIGCSRGLANVRVTIGSAPRAPDGTPDQHRVGWLELYFDLIFVASVIQLGNVLAADVSWQGVAKFAFVFVLLWWAWLGTTIYFGRFVADDIWHRILTFAQMLAVANMAVLVDGAFDIHVRGFLLSFVANQLVLAVMYLRAYRYVEDGRSAVVRTAVIIGLSATLFFVSVFTPPSARFVLLLAGLLVTFIPATFKDFVGLGERLAISREHVTERLGLFTIIVLGESFIKTVDALSGRPLPFPNAEVFGGLCFIVAASLWWTYFDDVAKARLKSGLVNTQVFFYAHLPLAMGITAFGVSTKRLVLLELGDPVPVEYLWLATVSVGIAMLAVAVMAVVTWTDCTPTGTVARVWCRVASAIGVVGIAGFGESLQAEFSLSLVTAVCVAQIAVESYQARAPQGTS